MPPPLAVEDASGEVRARQEAAAHLSGEAPVQARPLTSLAIKPVPATPVRDEDESDDEVMPTRKKRGYVTLSDRPPAASRPSTPRDASSSDDEVMPTKRPRGPPKRRSN